MLRSTYPALPYGCHFPSRAPAARHHWQISVSVYFGLCYASRTAELTTCSQRPTKPYSRSPSLACYTCPEVSESELSGSSIRASPQSPTTRRSAPTALPDEKDQWIPFHIVEARNSRRKNIHLVYVRPLRSHDRCRCPKRFSWTPNNQADQEDPTKSLCIRFLFRNSGDFPPILETPHKHAHLLESMYRELEVHLGVFTNKNRQK